jgi:GNAT superfamily N-acetyltransferase
VRVLALWWKTVSVIVGLRVARPEDASTLRDIGRRAGERFRRVNDIADHERPSVDALVGYVNARRCWVAFDDDDKPIGYLLVDDVDGNAHIEQVSVEPEHQGVGVGRSLIDQARTWAKDTGRPAVTLTTFAEFHAPLYAHLGYSVLQDHEIGPELRALRRQEAERGLDDLMPRVCMRLPL